MPNLPPKKPRSWAAPQRPPQAGRTFVNPWYHTTAWRTLRNAILRDNPFCVECRKNGIMQAANVVDHIKPVSSGKTAQEREILMWNESNLQGLCNACHNSKSGKEKNYGR